MTFKYTKYSLILLLSFSANSATDRVTRAVTNVNPSGNAVFTFPTTTPTASRVCEFGAGGLVQSSSTIDTTELGYLNGVSSTLCGINQSCTLTNKTLTAPTISTPTIIGASVINGVADAIQFKIHGNSPQTEPLMEVETGASSPLFRLTESLASYTVPIRVFGTLDAVQGQFTGAATQTANIFLVEADNGTDFLRVSAAGEIQAPLLTASRALTIGASNELAVSTVTSTELGRLSGVDSTVCGQSQTCTLTNKTFDADGTGNSITNIENADIKSGAAIDAAKLHDGTISNTEFGFLNNVSAALCGASQSCSLTNKTIDADGTGNSITNIENADIKAAAAIALNKLAATTASRALVSDGSGFVSAATTTATELGYVNGVTSAIQTQIDSRVSDGGDTMTGALFVDGGGDAIQGRFQGHGTQTNEILLAETSAGTDLFAVTNEGYVKRNGSNHYNLTRSLNATVDDTVDIGSFAQTNSAQNFDVAITVDDTNFSIAKRYIFTSQRGENTSTWRTVPAFSTTGNHNVNNFEFEILQDDTANSLSMRIRRTQGGVNSGTARISINHFGTNAGTFTPSTATASGVAATSGFPTSSQIVQVNSQVGIGTLGPAGKLDIDGSSDEPQLVVRGHSTQTNNMITVENDALANIFEVSGNGAVTIDATADDIQLKVQAHSTQTNNIVVVETSAGTDLATITNGGVLSLLTTTGRIAATAYSSTAGNGNAAAIFENDNATAAANTIVQELGLPGANDHTNSLFTRFYDSGGTIGSITAASATTVAYNTTSDQRLKENFEQFDGLGIVMQINPLTYEWKENHKRDIGFLAQDLYNVYPYAVTKGGDDVKKQPWQVDYGKLTPVLTKAIKQLKEENDLLKSRLSAVEEYLCSKDHKSPFCQKGLKQKR